GGQSPGTRRWASASTATQAEVTRTTSRWTSPTPGRYQIDITVRTPLPTTSQRKPTLVATAATRQPVRCRRCRRSSHTPASSAAVPATSNQVCAWYGQLVGPSSSARKQTTLAEGAQSMGITASTAPATPKTASAQQPATP